MHMKKVLFSVLVAVSMFFGSQAVDARGPMAYVCHTLPNGKFSLIHASVNSVHFTRHNDGIAIPVDRNDDGRLDGCEVFIPVPPVENG